MSQLLDPNPLADASHPRYEKIASLNRGAHGFVQLARDKLVTGTDDNRVAIKFMERGENITNYVLTEILNHRRLCHPHVVQFKEVFLTPRYLCIAMEYADGGDLFDYAVTRCKRLHEDGARWLFQQLVVGLDYCHKMGVACRDIKLENTLLTNTQPVLLKLCDFGFSKSENSAPAKSLVGTPAYLPPEVLTCSSGGQQTYNGQAADVWSSGVMLFTMLVGSYPFERPGDQQRGDRNDRMFERILKVDYHIPDALRLSDDCKDLLAKMLVKDPSQRITIPQIFTHPWFLKNLPAGVAEMNSVMEQPPAGLQSVQEIQAIVNAARTGADRPLLTHDQLMEECEAEAEGEDSL